jgi:D-alanine-D-alanine ligase
VRVAVLHGGRSSEHEVSLASAEAVTDGLAAAGHDPVGILLERGGAWRGGDGEPLALAPGGGLLDVDAAFPVLHGPFGEDGTVQGLLELLDVPYVGAGVLASALSMDKIVFKDVLAAAGVPQVGYAAVREAAWRADPDAIRAGLAPLGLPVFVKPARLGSSVGIAKVHDAGELDAALDGAFAHDPMVIVEAFSAGTEVECGVMGLHEADASVPGEVVLVGGAEWYDYEAKYTDGGVELRIPAGISATAAEEVRRLATETFLRVGCAGLARVDFFVEDGDRVLVNELNTLPGMTPTSAFPKLWEATGVPWPEACDRLVGIALERHRTERGSHAF